MDRNTVINLLMQSHGVSWETAYDVARSNDWNYMLAAGELRDPVVEFPPMVAPDHVTPVKISLYRRYLVNVTNGISKAGDVCEVADIFKSRCRGNNETARIDVYRDGLKFRTTSATVNQLNLQIAAGDITLL